MNSNLRHWGCKRLDYNSGAVQTGEWSNLGAFPLQRIYIFRASLLEQQGFIVGLQGKRRWIEILQRGNFLGLAVANADPEDAFFCPSTREVDKLPISRPGMPSNSGVTTGEVNRVSPIPVLNGQTVPALRHLLISDRSS